MFKLKNNFKYLRCGICILLVGLFIINNYDLKAVPNDEFVGEMRIVNSTVSSIDVLKKHPTFQEYFDFSLPYPCYNGNLGEFVIMWKIKNAPRNLLGVFFDDATRSDEDDLYTLEQLKYMGNGAQNMYIFWQCQ